MSFGMFRFRNDPALRHFRLRNAGSMMRDIGRCREIQGGVDPALRHLRRRNAG